eukprot:TRINITY_DN40380_c0_g1_i1.p2 TRINITY_DN40380_c0_g1~~TRINITY_DN40380_c0_g1_i1.p2  ORF type:complete len:153 (+),score=18.94 TRINITY_DN40380_c0_g1_i1:1328-1786(+)
MLQAMPLDKGVSSDVAAIWVSCCSEGLPIVRSTVGFVMMSGPIPQHFEFMRMLVSRECDFITWFQSSINSILHDDEQPDESFAVRLRPPGGAKLVEFKVECSMIRQTVDGFEEDSDDGQEVQLVFTHCEIVHVKRMKSRKKRCASERRKVKL